MSSASSNNLRGTSSYLRRRAGNACLVCRSRKTKCDNQRPVCGFCAATGGECRYGDSDPSQFDRASLAILQRLTELESRLVIHIDESLGSHGLVTANSAKNGARRASLTAELNPAPVARLGNHSYFPTDLLQDRPPSSGALLKASEMNTDAVLRWPIFTQAAPYLEREIHEPTLEFWAKPAHDLSKAYMSLGNIGSGLATNLDSIELNRLIENFFANNHIKNPVLDINMVRASARDFGETGPLWDGKSCLLFLVCAVSCISAPLSEETIPGPSKDPVRLARAAAYFQASQRRIGMLYHQNSLVVAQCTFLTGVYLMSNMELLAAWKSFVQAGTQCMAWLATQGKLKASETASHSNNDSTSRRVEGSLYWSCLKSEVELRFELGLPGSGINEIEHPYIFPSPPSNVNHGAQWQQASSSSPEASWSSPGGAQDLHNMELGWFFYLAEIALKRMVHNVMSWIYSARADDLDDARRTSDQHLQNGAVEFETQIQDWYDTLPPLMKFSTDRDQPTGDILRFILRGHMLDIREFVRLPVIYSVLSSPSFLSTDDYSTTYMKLTKELLENAVDRIKANREGWYHRHQGTWLMARSASRSALHLIGTALKCRQAALATGMQADAMENELLPPDWSEAVDDVVRLLEYWGDESSDLKRLSHIFEQLKHCYDNFGRRGSAGFDA